MTDGALTQLIDGPEFIDNKYRGWYFSLIKRAVCRALPDGFERHHVLPKSLGGKDSCRVALTYREHYLAHWLLTKCTVGQARKKMCHALWALTRRKDGGRVLTSSQYERARLAHRAALIGNKWAAGYVRTDEQNRAHGAALKGRKFTAEHKEKIGLANRGNKGRRGQKLSLETRLKMSKPKSAETRAKMSAALLGNKRMLGHRHTAESREKMSIARRATCSS